MEKAQGRWPLRGFPWLTVVVVGASIAAEAGPAERLQYSRLAVSDGEIWRLLTGQLVHWTPRMAATDLGVLLVCGAWVERKSRFLAAATLGAAAALVAIALHFVSPDVAVYRGSSGIASGMFAAAALTLALEAPSRLARVGAALLLLLLGVKIAAEVWAGIPLFAGPMPSGALVYPEGHAAGALAGALACCVRLATATES